MGRGHSDIGLVLVGQCMNRVDDGLGPVLVNKFYEGLQITASGIVIRILLQLAPGGEENEFWVRSTTARFQVLCSQRKRNESNAGKPGTSPVYPHPA
jgi:hypothetical protein